jgi:phosphatidylserine decarboxylase
MPLEMAGTVTYLDRRTGAPAQEKVYPEKLLRFVYEHPLGRALRYLFLQRAWVSRVYGRLRRRPSSRRAILAFVRSAGVDLSEVEKPFTEYRTLDEFFCRRLRREARPVDPRGAHLLSPADGCVLVFPRASDDGLVVKRSRVGLDELLGDAALARRYAGGSAVVIRLRPVDYHRFHFPDSGIASASRALGTQLHSVHPIALAAGAPAFGNKRMVTRLASASFGEMVMVEVGALAVGTIVQTFRPGPVERGQEKGLFHIGGSAIVVLLEPGRVRFDDDLCAASARGTETLVRYGTRIGRIP